MHYRDKARKAHASLLAKRIKATLYLELFPDKYGGYFFTDASWYLTYPHRNSRWEAEQERERIAFIRNSHKILTHNTLYYVRGIADYEQASHTIEQYHNAKYVDGNVRIYRLD